MNSIRSIFPRSPRVDPPVPRQIGHYEVIERLGTGVAAQVFLTRRRAGGGFQRLYALKVLHPHLTRCERSMELFFEEARIAARLHHHNVASIVDMEASPRAHYVAMDYVEGCTLAELLRHTGTYRPARMVVPILIDLLAGLHAAHELRALDGKPLRLVHRGVSPQNVLLGTDGVARVGDFGVARTRRQRVHTAPGVLRGHLGFSAPEQVLGKPLDPRTDVFSAGAVLWTALVGRSPFEGADAGQTVEQVLRTEVPVPSGEDANVPACLDRICLRALGRDMNMRYSSALQMARDLREVALEHDLLGSPVEVSDWVRRAMGDTLRRRTELIRGLEYPGSAVSTARTGGQVPRLPGLPPTLAQAARRALKAGGSMRFLALERPTKEPLTRDCDAADVAPELPDFDDIKSAKEDHDVAPGASTSRSGAGTNLLLPPPAPTAGGRHVDGSTHHPVGTQAPDVTLLPRLSPLPRATGLLRWRFLRNLLATWIAPLRVDGAFRRTAPRLAWALAATTWGCVFAVVLGVGLAPDPTASLRTVPLGVAPGEVVEAPGASDVGEVTLAVAPVPATEPRAALALEPRPGRLTVVLGPAVAEPLPAPSHEEVEAQPRDRTPIDTAVQPAQGADKGTGAPTAGGSTRPVLAGAAPRPATPRDEASQLPGAVRFDPVRCKEFIEAAVGGVVSSRMLAAASTGLEQRALRERRERCRRRRARLRRQRIQAERLRSIPPNPF